MPETNITLETADTMLTEWANQARQVLLFVLQGGSTALLTYWQGTLKVERAGIFLHTSGVLATNDEGTANLNLGQTMHFVVTKEFSELAMEEDEDFLRLWLRRGDGPARLEVAFAIPKGGDPKKLPLLTDWIQ
jgi:hypothetical protein